jgi:hypothetical protein
MDNQKLSELLNDIALINLERARTYEEASFQNQLYSVELRGNFALLANQSRQHNFMLKEQLEKLGVKRSHITLAGGDLYKQWTALPATFPGIDSKNILDNCEAGEEAVQVIYKKALDMPLTRDINQLLQHQLRGLENSSVVVKEILTTYKRIRK